MSRALQILLGLFGLLVVLVLAAVIIIPLVVDPNDYRDQIAEAVEEQTGRSFRIEGEISLSVFPWLGLEVGRMQLGNPPGFGEQPFAEIGSAAVGAKLMPLLSRRLEVSTLRLDGLRVHLIQLADGRNNWADLAADEPAAAPARRDAEPGFRLERVDGLRITDALVRFEDRKEGTTLEAAIPKLSTGELAPGRPFPVEAELALSLDEGKTRLGSTLAARVHLADDLGALELRELVLDAEATGEAVAGGDARLSMRGRRIDVDLEAMRGAIDTLAISGDARSAAGRQKFAARAPTLRFVIEGPALEVDQLELELEASGDEIPGGTQTARLAAPSVALDLGAQTLSIPALTAEAAGLRVNGELAGTRIVDAPDLTGRLGVDEFSPRGLLQRLGESVPHTADPAALGRASLGGRFRAGTDRLRLDELELRLDDTRISGNADIGLGEVMRVRSQLVLDAIDLDRYLPPEADEPVEPAPAEDVALVFDWLHGLDLDASFRAGRVKVNGLTMTDLEARAVARDGVLTLQPFGAALYGGQVRGSARLDARQSPATFSLEQSLSALQVLPFVQDLAGFDRLTGVAQLGAKLSTTASSTAGLMSGLNGELSFDVSDGVLKGVNLWYEIQRAHALARSRAAPERSSPDTDFRQLKGTAVVRDGLLVNQDLVGGLPFLALAGRGEINLAEAALDYRLTATVIRQAIDEATGEPSELAGASVPLRLSGALDAPSVSVDLGGLLRDRAAQEALRRLGVEDEGRTVEEEIRERAQDRIRGLRDRLRRDD